MASKSLTSSIGAPGPALSKHEQRKQKKKQQKRKRVMSSNVSIVAGKRSQMPGRNLKSGQAKISNSDAEDDDDEDGESNSETEIYDENAKMVATDQKAPEHAEEASTHKKHETPISSFLDGNEYKSPVDVLAWMIAPITVEAFFRDYWEKKPLHIKRRKPKYYKQVLTQDDMTDILQKNFLKYSINVDIARYENGARETFNPEGRAHAHVVWDFFEQGNSVRILNPQSYHNPLWRLNACLQEYFSCMVGTNSYLTPAGAQGFAPHYDDIEAFILQTEGAKRWRLYTNISGQALPRDSSRNFSQSEIGHPFMDIVLEAGDMLYFPRGVIHQGVSMPTTHSLHVTVSTYQNNAWFDYLSLLLPRGLELAAEEDVAFREGLPLKFMSYMGVTKSENKDPRRTKFEKHVKALLTKLVDHLPYDAAADRLAVKFMHDSLPPAHTKDQHARTVYGKKRADARPYIGLTTEVKAVREFCGRLLFHEDKVELYYLTENSLIPHGEDPQSADFPLDMAEGIQYLLDSFKSAVLVSTIPGLADSSEQLELAESLYDLGLLEAIPDDPSTDIQ